MIALGIPAWEPTGYRTSPRSRVSALAGILLLAAALLMLALWRGSGLADAPGQGGAGLGELTVIEFPAADQSPSTPQQGGGQQGAIAPGAGAEQVAEIGPAGAGDVKNSPGGAAYGDQLARLLAEDPLAGGGAADYAVILRRHVAAHISAPAGSDGRRSSGTVVVRFRVARDGRIVDARVLQAMSAPLDEAALAALWRSEPLPRVPLNLAAPIEVDVPIEFRTRD